MHVTSSYPPAARPHGGQKVGVPAHRDSLLALQGLVEPEELSVVFQPIVDMKDGHVFAYEALVRCARNELKNPHVLFERAVSAGDYVMPATRVATLVDTNSLRVEITVPEADVAMVKQGMLVDFRTSGGAGGNKV